MERPTKVIMIRGSLMELVYHHETASAAQRRASTLAELHDCKAINKDTHWEVDATEYYTSSRPQFKFK